MITIQNDDDLRAALTQLDAADQRQLAALFVENVLEYTHDSRLRHALSVVIRADASEEELKAAHRTARAAALDAHARCGADSNWSDQSPYFVARAAEAATGMSAKGSRSTLAWLVAMQCRMATCCEASETDQESEDNTCSAQRRIAAEFINSRKDNRHE